MADDDYRLEVETVGHGTESESTSPPVVLVQYRNRGVPLWIFIPLVFVIPLSAILIYHRMVVAKYRTQAIRAREALESQLESTQTSVPHPMESKALEPLALNSQPIRADLPPSPPATVPMTTVGSVTITSSSPAPVRPIAPSSSEGAKAPPQADAVAETLPADSAPSPTGGAETDGDRPSHSAPPANVGVSAMVGAGTSSRPQSILGNPVITFGRPGLAADPAEGNAESTRGPATKPAGDGSSAPESVVQADKAIDDPFEIKAEALPTKEESLQQIKDEAAKKQADFDALDQNKEAEFHAIRRGERIRFRDSLRDVLKVFGNNAGPEIDKLAQQYGYDQDRDRFMQARYAWKFARMSTESRVKLTRSLDLPETTILNFLSEDIDKQIGARGGPRNRNEVRIRAAKMLLNFPLPAADAPAKPRTSGRPNPDVASRSPSSRTTSSRRSVARSQ